MTQEITFYDKPSPHVIIDDYLPKNLAKECLEECIKLEKAYQPADVGQHEHFDDCEECKNEKKWRAKNIRENDVVYLDQQYRDNRSDSVILGALELAETLDPFIDAFIKKGFFHIIRRVTHSHSILSRYGMCDFYGYHYDQLKSEPPSRIITLIYYMNKEPEQFTGGDLIITGSSREDKLKIKPKHNRAVIFQSDSTYHAVDSVRLLNDDFSSGRFSINHWLGFEGFHKFR